MNPSDIDISPHLRDITDDVKARTAEHAASLRDRGLLVGTPCQVRSLGAQYANACLGSPTMEHEWKAGACRWCGTRSEA